MRGRAPYEVIEAASPSVPSPTPQRDGTPSDTADLFHVEYGWDAWGNPTFKRDLTPGYDDRSELYAHDARDRLRQFERGTLNAQGTAITTPTPSAYLPQEQAWPTDGPPGRPYTLDRRSNWLETVTTVAGETTTCSGSA